MNLFERFIHFFEGEMETPTNYGWFHLMFIGIVILFTVFLCLKFKDCDDKIFRRITLICWITIVALEILKQLVFSFEFDGTNAVWDYQWYAFPYQFCSTPLYVLPFIAFLRDATGFTCCLYGILLYVCRPGSILLPQRRIYCNYRY